MLDDELLGLTDFLEGQTLCFVLGWIASRTVVDKSASWAKCELFVVG
jgi:hypothetical protein